MKKMLNYIAKNWVWLFIGLVFTQYVVVKCHGQRGGFYIGGEWLILPAAMAMKHSFENLIHNIRMLEKERK